MQRIINFVLRYRNTFLYAFLLCISLMLTIRSHSYHQSKYFNSSRWISGTIYNTSSSITSYFDLKQENKRLAAENEKLRALLFNLPEDSSQVPLVRNDFEVIQAKITKNSYASPRNYITINKGKNDGLTQDMGVITTNGILGIVENTSNGYATVQSILNTKSNINAKIKHTNYFGSLIWNGDRYDVVQLIDIPRLVPVAVGDTIVTGAMSSIFPEDIPIGIIKKYSLNEAQSFYNIDIQLFNDMANLKQVYIIKNRNRTEIMDLEKKTNDAQ